MNSINCKHIQQAIDSFKANSNPLFLLTSLFYVHYVCINKLSDNKESEEIYPKKQREILIKNYEIELKKQQFIINNDKSLNFEELKQTVEIFKKDASLIRDDIDFYIMLNKGAITKVKEIYDKYQRYYNNPPLSFNNEISTKYEEAYTNYIKEKLDGLVLKSIILEIKDCFKDLKNNQVTEENSIKINLIIKLIDKFLNPTSKFRVSEKILNNLKEENCPIDIILKFYELNKQNKVSLNSDNFLIIKKLLIAISQDLHSKVFKIEKNFIIEYVENNKQLTIQEKNEIKVNLKKQKKFLDLNKIFNGIKKSTPIRNVFEKVFTNKKIHYNVDKKKEIEKLNEIINNIEADRYNEFLEKEIIDKNTQFKDEIFEANKELTNIETISKKENLNKKDVKILIESKWYETPQSIEIDELKINFRLKDFIVLNDYDSMQKPSFSNKDVEKLKKIIEKVEPSSEKSTIELVLLYPNNEYNFLSYENSCKTIKNLNAQQKFELLSFSIEWRKKVLKQILDKFFNPFNELYNKFLNNKKIPRNLIEKVFYFCKNNNAKETAIKENEKNLNIIIEKKLIKDLKESETKLKQNRSNLKLNNNCAKIYIAYITQIINICEKLLINTGGNSEELKSIKNIKNFLDENYINLTQEFINIIKKIRKRLKSFDYTCLEKGKIEKIIKLVRLVNLNIY